MPYPVILAPERLAWLETMVAANLLHTAHVESATRVFEPGGTGGPIGWATATVLATHAANVSPASAPQEQLSAGAITSIQHFFVTMPKAATVPSDTGTTFHRIRFVPTIPGIASPLYFYPIGTPVRSFKVLTKVLCTTVAPK
jgi:hypothetical protein